MRVSVVAALASATFALAVTGCTNGTTPTEPSVSPTPSPTFAGQVASCVVGTWHSIDAKGANVAGGGGVMVVIAPNGDVTMDFANMQPATFSVRVAETDIKGSFVYSGKASGKVRTFTTSGTSGDWEPDGPIDWSQLKVSADLTAPVQAKPLDNLPIADYLGDKSSSTGNIVDIAPMLGKGTFTCEGATLVLTPENNKGLTWTLGRKD